MEMTVTPDAVLCNAAHELTTMLTLLQSSIRSIETAHPEVRCYRYWPELVSDCSLMHAFLRDLTDYSAGSQLNCRRTDFVLLTRKAYLSCLSLTEGTEKRLTFTSRVASAWLSLDAGKMTEALLNVIVNALDAIPDDGWVHLLLTKNRQELTLEISDNGCGIEPQHLVHIFQPFVTTKENGTGLGLPVAKRIIEGHGGHIRISSAPGRGTAFAMVLPLAPAKA